MDTLAERFAVKGSDGEDCGEDEMDFAIAILWYFRGLRDTGVGGGGFTGVILLKTDEANYEGAEKKVGLREISAPERDSTCTVQSG